MSKNKKHIKAWQLFLIGLFFSVGARLAVGGMVGSLFAIFGDVLIIISIVQAIITGVKSFAKKSGPEDEIKKYATVLGYLSVKSAQDFQKEYDLKHSEYADITVQLISFCLMNLLRKFKSNDITTEKSRGTIEEIVKHISETISDESIESNSANSELMKQIGSIVSKHGHLPLKNSDSDKGQEGTLPWEYGKLMTQSLNKDPLSDLMVIMKCTSVATNVCTAIETDELIKSLR